LLQGALDHQGVVILDGAMATELEQRGAPLDDRLWSAIVLLQHPEWIESVHYDYFAAGADVAITATYQATFEGFAAIGLDRDQAQAVLRRSVEVARSARTRFMASERFNGRIHPLIAASVGPYGAYLADGAEYRGDYGLSVKQLMDWHRPRFEVLASSSADLLACETIPCLEEGEALVRLMEEYGAGGWLSFSCRDGSTLNHGEPISEAVALADSCPTVQAVGVNCTAPHFIEALLAAARSATRKPLLCYPNSGERWDGAHHCWVKSSDGTDFGDAAQRWYHAGARLLGGCCRTGPTEIAAIRRALVNVT
jgi:homocysteine S-methyltransferase